MASFLENGPSFLFVFYAIFASFSTYFCMYAFRKPFASAKFEGLSFLGSDIELKTAIVISQILGYAVSKYAGIKVCSEVTPTRRAWMLIFLILWAQASLVVYGMVPDNFKVVAIFFNGLPLGMVWGLVVWYLEGRRTSELLLAGLSCSFIVSSGIVKDVGRAIMSGSLADLWLSVPLIGPWIGGSMGEVSEGWMPAVTGFHFLPLFFLAVWMLNQIPTPNQADRDARTRREPMSGADRIGFLKKFMPGLILLCVAYFFLTAYRDYRDNYMVEIFEELGYGYEDNQAIISKTELLVAFGVILVLALLNMIKDNRWGLIGAFAVMTSGAILMGLGTFLFQSKMITGFWWMTLVGLGSYLCYVPYGSVLFDRMIASTKVIGTAVFAIYLADAIGYTGSVGIQLYKDLIQSEMTRLGFFVGYTYFMCIVGTLCLISSCVYFVNKKPVD